MSALRRIVTPPWRRAVLLIVLLMAWFVLVTTNKRLVRAVAPEFWIPVNVPARTVG